MVLSRRLKYIVRILVWGFIGFHIGLLILLNIPSVQGKLASLVSTELGKVLNTEVSVTGLINVSYYKLPKNYRDTTECHDFWELVYVDKGEIIVTVDDESFALS